MVRLFCLILIIPLSIFVLTGCSEEQASDSSSQFISAEEIEAFTRVSLKIVTQEGRNLYFEVEIADTSAAITKGLMFRGSMRPDHGMIFLFNNMQPRSFWMRNTYIPLDILYIGAGGKIVNIKQGRPLDETGIPSDYPAQAAIELNAGTALRMNIQVGDVVHFSRLKY